jgi:hypothetical protein
MPLRVTIFLILVALSVSCTKRGVQLRSDTLLSVAEEQNVLQQTGLLGWRPECSALWVQSGVTSRVCIADSGFSGLRASYSAFVFRLDGQLLEANVLPARSGAPKAVMGIMPLRVRFEANDGRSWIEDGSYLRGEGISEVRRHSEESEERWKIFKKWQASGDTNKEHLFEMIHEAKLGRQP